MTEPCRCENLFWEIMDRKDLPTLPTEIYVYCPSCDREARGFVTHGENVVDALNRVKLLVRVEE